MTTMPEAATPGAAAPKDNDILLEVQDLQMYFPVGSGFLSRKPTGYVKAVDGVSFTVKRGETQVWWAKAAAARPPPAGVFSSFISPQAGR